jgi:hypothetical protein
MRDPYRRDGWEPLRDQLSPYSSDGDWNRLDRTPHQTESGVWQFGSDAAASGHQRAARPGGNTAKVVAIGVVAVAILVAAWVFTHRVSSVRSTPVTTTITIPIINATWAPPPAGAAPAMTAEQAWLKWSHQGKWAHGGFVGMTVQLGLITQSMGPRSRCGFVCDGLRVRNGIAYRALNELAYGFYWANCPPGSNRPARQCWSWTFVNANTGKLITGAISIYARVSGP